MMEPMAETIVADAATELAEERTLLAWIRTGLAIMGLGFVVARFGLFLREITLVKVHPAASSTGFSPTDAGQLPDGRVLIVNRRFTIIEGVSAKLTIVDPRQIVENQILPSRLIATLKPPLRIDNMEALSIEQRHGRTIVWLASDDNFNPLQQTLLMKFALKDEPKR